MQFKPINFNTWPRREMFRYFSKMATTGYSITTEVETGNMRRVLREEGIKFFPAYLWLTTKCLCEQDEFKIAEIDSVLARKESLPPPNAYTVSCIPWVEFTHFAVHSYENKPCYLPSVEAGRLREEGDKTYMPLSLTCHHATTDGWHIKEFLRAFQSAADHFERYV